MDWETLYCPNKRCKNYGIPFQVVVHGKNGSQVPLVSEVVSLLAQEGVAFHDLRTEQASLEDVFLSLTGRAMRE